MIIAGPCLYADHSMTDSILRTAEKLHGVADMFRCKLWGGGTRPDRYIAGIGSDGIKTLAKINEKIPVMVEVQTAGQMRELLLAGINNIWIGSRNSSNYGLIEEMRHSDGYNIWIKRDFSMTLEESINIVAVWSHRLARPVRLIDRGVMTFDWQDRSRWMPDVRFAMMLKHDRADMFRDFVVDCSHSVGQSWMVGDTYKAFRSIGVQNFMFEVLNNPTESMTDMDQIINVDVLRAILESAK